MDSISFPWNRIRNEGEKKEVYCLAQKGKEEIEYSSQGFERKEEERTFFNFFKISL